MTTVLKYICDHWSYLRGFCASGFRLETQVASALIGIIVGYILSTFGTLLSLLRPRYWRLFGRWYKYGLGFYDRQGTQPLYVGYVLLIPVPPLTFVFSFNKTYSYVGTIRTLGNTLYIHWRGIFHSERMLSVFCEPLHVNDSTRLFGVKSCITKYGEPAANKELLSKKPVGKTEIYELLGGRNSQIVITNPVRLAAHYE